MSAPEVLATHELEDIFYLPLSRSAFEELSELQQITQAFQLSDQEVFGPTAGVTSTCPNNSLQSHPRSYSGRQSFPVAMAVKLYHKSEVFCLSAPK